MEMEVITKETIKPSSLTLHHLRSFKLFLLDQLMPPIYTPLVLFYAISGGDGGGDKKSDDEAASKRSQLLKNFLSETLTRFYPLAGRIKDHLSVDCNDVLIILKLELTVQSPAFLNNQKVNYSTISFQPNL
ncbi:hypothetical protein ACSBR2_040835 [Camellia fascicularis]